MNYNDIPAEMSTKPELFALTHGEIELINRAYNIIESNYPRTAHTMEEIQDTLINILSQHNIEHSALIDVWRNVHQGGRVWTIRKVNMQVSEGAISSILWTVEILGDTADSQLNAVDLDSCDTLNDIITAGGVPSDAKYIHSSNYITINYIAAICGTVARDSTFIKAINNPLVNAFNRLGRTPSDLLTCIMDNKVNQKHIGLTTVDGRYIINLKFDGTRKPEQLLSQLKNANAEKLLLHALYNAVKYNTRDVYISREEFMQLRGLTDKREAMRTADEAKDTLLNTTIRLTSEVVAASINILEYALHIGGKGKSAVGIGLKFTETFYSTMLAGGLFITEYPSSMLKLQRNPYEFTKYIYDDYRNNLGKRGNVILVDKLLSISDLPVCTDEIKKAGHLYRDIVRPFEKALNTAAENSGFRWEYVHSRYKALTEEERQSIRADYEYFKRLYIKYTFLPNKAPHIGELIKGREEHKETAKKKRGRPKKEQ